MRGAHLFIAILVSTVPFTLLLKVLNQIRHVGPSHRRWPLPRLWIDRGGLITAYIVHGGYIEHRSPVQLVGDCAIVRRLWLCVVSAAAAVLRGLRGFVLPRDRSAWPAQDTLPEYSGYWHDCETPERDRCELRCRDAHVYSTQSVCFDSVRPGAKENSRWVGYESHYSAIQVGGGRRSLYGETFTEFALRKSIRDIIHRLRDREHLILLSMVTLRTILTRDSRRI
jgi:hypothetical protein